MISDSLHLPSRPARTQNVTMAIHLDCVGQHAHDTALTHLSRVAMLPAQSHIYIDRWGGGILSYKYRPHTHIYDFTSDNTKVYNKPCRLRDLRQSIMKAKPRAPWPGGIHNNPLKHLPEDTLKILKEILNKIWISGDFPHQWRAAKVILIPKSNKDHANPPIDLLHWPAAYARS